LSIKNNPGPGPKTLALPEIQRAIQPTWLLAARSFGVASGTMGAAARGGSLLWRTGFQGLFQW